MQDTDAVSCLLCLQADEYGSMIRVCVPAGRIPPSPERVICQRCADAITEVYFERTGEQIDRRTNFDNDLGLGGGADPAPRPDADPEWDRGLPERAVEPLVEVDRSEPENATGSSKPS